MGKLTYRQAYDKIIDAYFKDEIQPLNPRFCFCGTLCDNSASWHWGARANHADSHGYTGDELRKMEVALMHHPQLYKYHQDKKHPRYEDSLFLAMTAALEVLKQIHRDRGEDVDEVPGLRKRELVKI